MKILFITSTRLGDAVLSTGALDHFLHLYPDAEVTVACGPLVASLFAPIPQVKKVISLKKEPYAGHWIALARKTFWSKWDIIVDLRNSLLSRLLYAGKVYVWGAQDKNKHKVEQIAEVIGVSPPPAPRLWFDAEVLKAAEGLIPAGKKILAIGPAANWRAKTWPGENFLALVARLTGPDGVLPGAIVAVFGAPGEEDTAGDVLHNLPPDRRIDLVGKTTPLVAAAALKRCDMYIGNDSGLMHCAAAVGIPTLGLFGPSWPHLYRPWGENTSYVAAPENYKELISYEGYRAATAPCLMTSLTVTAAHAAAVDLWQKAVIKNRITR